MPHTSLNDLVNASYPMSWTIFKMSFLKPNKHSILFFINNTDGKVLNKHVLTQRVKIQFMHYQLILIVVNFFKPCLGTKRLNDLNWEIPADLAAGRLNFNLHLQVFKIKFLLAELSSKMVFFNILWITCAALMQITNQLERTLLHILQWICALYDSRIHHYNSLVHFFYMFQEGVCQKYDVIQVDQPDTLTKKISRDLIPCSLLIP